MPTNRLVVKEKVATYATALFNGALMAGKQEGVLEARDDMEQALHHIRSNMDLASALSESGYSPEQRNELATKVFAGYNEVLVQVIAIMAERGDIDMLSRVWHAYEKKVEEELSVVVVDVTTAVALDAKLRKAISAKLEKDFGKSVVLREHIDESILGGIIMSAQGKRIDASVVSQLASARSVLKTTTDGGEG